MVKGIMSKILKKINRIIINFFVLKNKILFSFQKKYVKINGSPIILQKTIISGEGRIIFGHNVNLGVIESPRFLGGEFYISARKEGSEIKFGNNIYINNNANIISNSGNISIGDNTLIGFDVTIVDSDFHFLSPNNRMDENAPSKAIVIGKNVFIGSNVKILKGVTIGDNSIIGLGSIVTKNIPKNVVFAGNPGRIIKYLSEDNSGV